MFRCVRGEGEVWADRTFLHCPTDNDGSITGSLMKQSLGRRDEKPRTMVASRHGAGSPGGREEREPEGWGARAVAAKHRALPPCGTGGGARNGTRGVRTTTGRGGAMGTSRPTAMPHEGCARQWGTRGEHGREARPRDDAARWGHRALPLRGTGGAHAI